ncbi:MAG: prepilin-type N-terminal cleavage/methylation domain-containing protein [Gemmatimonadota bacterium]
MTKRSRRGFTLVELMIALMIGSVVVLLAHQIFSSAGDGIRQLASARQRLETEQLGNRWLESAMLSLETGGAGGQFDGHPDRMTFSTWLMTPYGWIEREHVSLGVSHGKLVADEAQEQIKLYDGVRTVSFDYLLEPGLNSRWVNDWVSPVSAPLAVRIRLERSAGTDTLLFLIKGRG